MAQFLNLEWSPRASTCEPSILPENNENLVGFAAHPSCLAVAMRYLMPVADYDEAGAVTDPDTGLTFGYLRYTETSSNLRHGRVPLRL